MLYTTGMEMSDAMQNEPLALTLSLIGLAKQGDNDAFGQLYEMFYTPLFRFVKSRTKNHDLSVDICQETFIKWYKSMPTYEVKMKPLSYLFMIAMRLIINNSKKKASIGLPDDADEYIADDNEPLQNILDFEMEIDKITALFDELNEDQKNVLTMRYISDADTQTIADALEKNIVNIRKIEERALKKIREMYIERHSQASYTESTQI
jgi:RNA polymerase sigma-70 factor (ECF subfamily)